MIELSSCRYIAITLSIIFSLYFFTFSIYYFRYAFAISSLRLFSLFAARGAMYFLWCRCSLFLLHFGVAAFMLMIIFAADDSSSSFSRRLRFRFWLIAMLSLSDALWCLTISSGFLSLLATPSFRHAFFAMLSLSIFLRHDFFTMIFFFVSLTLMMIAFQLLLWASSRASRHAISSRYFIWYFSCVFSPSFRLLLLLRQFRLLPRRHCLLQPSFSW